jgi:two-component system, chemotaxis family, sensor kinase Cph1
MPEYEHLSREELLRQVRELETARQPDTVADLRDSEERLHAILRTAVEGIITIDEWGIVETMNPAAETIFGWKAQEMVGRNVSNLMPMPYSREHDSYLQNYVRGGHAKIIGIGREVKGLRKDGTVFPMDLAVSEVRLSDRRLFAGFVRDITERKRAEAKLEELAQTLAEKNKELEAIVYVASHDLRSPLVNIQGFSRELAHSCDRLQNLLTGPSASTREEELRAVLERDIPESLDYIQAGVVKIDALLSGFLRYSRLGRAAITIRPLEMNALLGAVAKAMVFQVQKAGAKVDVQPLPECLGDEIQLSQVFSNLLDNALKYLDARRPGVITVSGKVQDGRAVFAVRDNGIGMPREHLPRIFEIFHRLNPSFGQGEGLGLTIAQRLLERQNGKIWVDSTPGEGSVFFVSLPRP